MVRRRPDSTAAPRTALTRAVCLPLQVHNSGGTTSTVRPMLRLRARRRRRRWRRPRVRRSVRAARRRRSRA
eukprot:1229765-Prymnesium_polylepis.1